MREHSRAELARKLMPHVAPEDDLDGLLSALVEQGWLSDERAAQSMVRRRSDRLGLARVTQELKAKGLSADAVAQAVEGLVETEHARALQVWTRKFGHAPTTAAERAKHIRFLMGRGFSADAIRAALRQAQEAVNSQVDRDGGPSGG